MPIHNPDEQLRIIGSVYAELADIAQHFDQEVLDDVRVGVDEASADFITDPGLRVIDVVNIAFIALQQAVALIGQEDA